MHTEIQQLLQNKGLKSTSKRIEILLFLKKQNKPVTVEDIHKAVQKKMAHHMDSLDLATVYRNLKQLVEVGLVRKSFFEESKIQYTLAHDQNHSHDHHIQCVKCEKIEPVSICLPPQHKKLLSELGYQKVTHRLEFFGVCSTCKS